MVKPMYWLEVRWPVLLSPRHQYAQLTILFLIAPRQPLMHFVGFWETCGNQPKNKKTPINTGFIEV